LYAIVSEVVSVPRIERLPWGLYIFGYDKTPSIENEVYTSTVRLIEVVVYVKPLVEGFIMM
jgi:hypothetical protein